MNTPFAGHARPFSAFLALVLSLCVSACQLGGGRGTTDIDDGGDSGVIDGGTTECGSNCPTDPPPDSLDAELAGAVVDTLLRGCDALDPQYCLFPFPNDFYTTADTATDTGMRVNLNIAAMPRNVLNKPVDPTEWNRNDGFSPGSLILTRVPELSLNDALYEANGLSLPHLVDIEHSLDANSAIVLVDATPTLPGTDTPNPLYGQQHLIWAELDANTTATGVCDATNPALLLGDLAGLDPVVEFFQTVSDQCSGLITDDIDPMQNDPLNDPGPALLIHPGVNLEEGHRYIVALRGLRDANGALLTPAPGFQVYRDNVPSSLPGIEDRRAHMEDLFAELEDSTARVHRRSLYLAWDFTVISERNLTERALHMRNVAFANYLPENGGTPSYSIDSVEDFPLEGDDCLGSAADANDPGRGDRNSDFCIARRVIGTITVPSFMTIPRVDLPEDTPLVEELPIPATQYVGGRLYSDPLDTDELPDVNPLTPTEQFVFSCNIPRSAFGGAVVPAEATSTQPTRVSLYGHGLLGSQGEGRGQAQLKRFANEHNFSFCMTDWIGMSHYDLANVATLLADMSLFPSLADRAQQGFLTKMFLARLLVDPNGFVADPAFQVNGQPLIDNSHVFYDGNSQGGIMGGALVALSPDIQRGSLGVIGMNYSTLLSRSVDFAPYGAIYYTAYPESLDQQMVFSLIQMLWDRAENDGYAQHLGDGQTRNARVGIANRPLPGLPEGAYDESAGPFAPEIARMPQKEVLLHPAFGDHQVTHWSAEVMARTIGANGADAYFRTPDAQDSADGTVQFTYPSLAAFLSERTPDNNDFFALGLLDYADADAIAGSAFILWDEGKTAAPPTNNTFPADDDFDPHEYPRRTVAARCQKARFLRADGRVIDTGTLSNANDTECPLSDGTGAAFAP